jgi:hypothetical protein
MMTNSTRSTIGSLTIIKSLLASSSLVLVVTAACCYILPVAAENDDFAKQIVYKPVSITSRANIEHIENSRETICSRLNLMIVLALLFQLLLAPSDCILVSSWVGVG